MVGPNGSGKTQLLRALKQPLGGIVGDRKVRFLSAGRMAHLEQFRSDYDGQRGTTPRYDRAQLGSKDYGERRHKIETALGDFHTLSLRPDLQIKVSERLRKLFHREVFLEWDAGNLKVKFARVEAANESYSSAREASGLLQLVVLLAALYDDDVGALLIDEPEVSLHPQLQSFLLREMKRVAGDPEDPHNKIIVTATHSTEFLDMRAPEDIANVVFCSTVTAQPKQVRPDVGELRGKKVRSLLKRLGQEQKLAFFADRPTLLEGPSDRIVCSGLDNKLDLYLEAAGAQLVPVIGKGEIPTVVKLMRMMGKKPVVLVDLDAIADGTDLVNLFVDDDAVHRSAQEYGHADARKFATGVYSDFAQMIQDDWDGVSRLITSVNPDAEQSNANRRRLALAALLSTPEREIQELGNGDDWLAVKRRMVSLLDFLENAGCFILRKGSIEAYYQFADRVSGEGKPEAAVQEVEGIEQQTHQFVNEHYDDIIRGLRFAASVAEIDEASALKEVVLALGAPALNHLDGGGTPDTLPSSRPETGSIGGRGPARAAR